MLHRVVVKEQSTVSSQTVLLILQPAGRIIGCWMKERIVVPFYFL